MRYSDLLGGFRLFGDSLGRIIRWPGGFQSDGWFEVVLVDECILVLVNVKGFFFGGGGEGRSDERTD